MISINNVSVVFGGVALFENISFAVKPKDRIGLTGKNGAGKSTLLKIICGIQSCDSGTISVPKGKTIGYLPQTMKYPEGKTVQEETLTAFGEILKIEKELQKLTAQLAQRTDYESPEYLKIIEHINLLQDKFSDSGGYTLEAECEKILKGLGFTPEDFSRDVTEFSGGWRMRIELAKILLQKPDLLLLDEPTNHLDIESIEWVEELFSGYGGAIILISHDRLFLDNITHRTIEIANKKIYDYKAPYSKYVAMREERMEQQKAAFENQQKQIADTQKFIEKFRSKATKAVQVQSKIKQLEKMERIEIDETDVSRLRFSFPEAPRSGDIVVETESLSKSYGEHKVLEDIWLSIERGQKIALVGKNGQGKTTFVRIIKGELEYQGKLKIGHKVKIGYFAQNQEKVLNENKTVFEILDDTAVGDVRTKIRDILGSFLFGEEDIDKKVSVLSGGERSRLALAKLMLEPYNLLILDEPTNHLDMHSKDILKQALKEYNGTLLLVSHDRYFLQDLTDEIYEFKDKKIKKHAGDIRFFLEKKRREEKIKQSESQNNKTGIERKDKTSKNGQEHYQKRKELERQIRALSKKLAQNEADIEKLEEEIEQAEKIFSSQTPVEQDESYFQSYEDTKKELSVQMQEWEELSLKIQELSEEKERL